MSIGSFHMLGRVSSTSPINSWFNLWQLQQNLFLSCFFVLVKLLKIGSWMDRADGGTNYIQNRDGHVTETPGYHQIGRPCFRILFVTPPSMSTDCVSLPISGLLSSTSIRQQLKLGSPEKGSETVWWHLHNHGRTSCKKGTQIATTFLKTTSLSGSLFTSLSGMNMKVSTHVNRS